MDSVHKYQQLKTSSKEENQRVSLDLGLSDLSKLKGVFVKQEFESFEVFTGCETENKYTVFGADQEGNPNGEALFECKEKSSWIARNCLSGDCRPFQVIIKNILKNGTPMLELSREFKCTCLCFNRPSVSVFTLGNERTLLGTLVSPFNFFDYQVNVYNAKGVLKYLVRAKCCQYGVICKNAALKKCQTVNFEVFDGEGNQLEGIFEKRTAGVLKSIISDCDNFCCTFKDNTINEDKALLMSALIFLDFAFFERSSKRKSK